MNEVILYGKSYRVGLLAPREAATKWFASDNESSVVSPNY